MKVTPFRVLFGRWAGRVRRRLLARHALTGATFGLALAAAAALVGWKTRHDAVRRWAPALGLAGAAVAVVLARRRRWSDTDVALFLDDRLAANEAITTAVEHEDHAVVVNATQALETSKGARVGPMLLRPVHLAAPAAAVALFFLVRAPLPPAPIARAAPGSSKLELLNVRGLDKVIDLGKAEARDPAQRERLDQIAKDAEKLREDLQRGLEKREAQDRLAHLRDEIAAERLSLGDGERRAGMESAVSKLEESEATRDAAKALGDHDLATMDSEMERLANQREKQDRELARKELADAADAARKAGAPDVGKALEEEKKLLEERGRRADMLRDLAKALDASGTESDELKRDLDALGKSGKDKDAEKLADAMGKALEQLTPEERKRLADKLRDQAKGGSGSGDAQDLKDLADDLSTPEGQKKLEQELKDLAKEDTDDSESERQQGLDDAEKGTDDAEGDVDGQQGQGQGQGQQDGSGDGKQHGEQGKPGDGHGGESGHGDGVPIPIPMNGSGGNADNGKSGPGGSHDVGGGDHGGGNQGNVDAETLRSRAHGRVNKGSPMPGTVMGLSLGRAGGTANVRGTGELRTVGPHEVDGVDHSDVPEEYRDQVRQYFQP